MPFANLNVKKASVTDEEFGQAMTGDIIDKATNALFGGHYRFFPRCETPSVPKSPDRVKAFPGSSEQKTGSLSGGRRTQQENRLETGRIERLIYECAGICGVNPDPFTLHELIIMSEARGEFEWQQTSSLMAIVANIMRDPKKGKAVSPDDFNPYSQKKKSTHRQYQ